VRDSRPGGDRRKRRARWLDRRRQGETGTAHLAERTGAHQNALRGVGPVDAPDLDAGIIVEADGEIVIVEMRGAERALDRQIVHGKADTVLDLGGGDACGGFEGGAIKSEIPVMIGEAEAGAIATGEAPAPGERGGAAVEVGLQSGGQDFHECSPL
jgi:hypothetical protein